MHEDKKGLSEEDELGERNGLHVPAPQPPLFRELEVAQFLYSPRELHERVRVERRRLPATRLMLQNAFLIMASDALHAWPLCLRWAAAALVPTCR